jgi:prevent-host-death family protein
MNLDSLDKECEMKAWQIQQAKQRLSEVIRLAASEGPQMITHHGQPSAWIISEQEYSKLTQQKESIVDFFQRSPHRDVQLKIERRKDAPRTIDL